MQRILTLVAIASFLCSSGTVFQDGGGQATKNGASKKKLGTPNIQSQLLTRQSPEDAKLRARQIPKSTSAAFDGYLRSHLNGFELTDFELYSMPRSTEQFFVTVSGMVKVDGTDYNTSILVLLRKHGGDITESGRFEKDGPLVRPYFFIGTDRVLLIVWISAYDGAYYGSWAFEYRNETLKALGEIDVVDEIPNELIYNRSPIDTATAEYKRGTYYLTMRGRGTLYRWDESDNRQKLARRGVPVTYVYEQGAWVPARIRK